MASFALKIFQIKTTLNHNIQEGTVLINVNICPIPLVFVKFFYFFNFSTCPLRTFLVYSLFSFVDRYWRNYV